MHTVKIDGLDRVHIPTKMRKELNWEDVKEVVMTTDGEKLIIYKSEPISECPSCKNKFTSKFSFCPYCGQYLKDLTKESDNASVE